MFKRGIIISWQNAEEHIEIDINSSSMPKIHSTLEWWPEWKQFVRYNTSSKAKWLPGNKLELKISYKQSDNPTIPRDSACWGTSTICLTKGDSSGFAKWADETYPEHDGTSRWKLISQPPKARKRMDSSQLERNQEKFRSALIAYEARCAITGETTLETLEAAHIIPCANDGKEFVENGILLRADLHKLFDAGKFCINPQGKIVNIKAVSSEYSKLLRGARLAPETTRRVRESLKERWRPRA